MRFNAFHQILLPVGVLLTASGEVAVLNDRNFDDIVGGEHHVLVEHYAPWCGHCKALEPEYNIVGETFNADQDSVIIAKVDCDEEKPRCVRNSVKGYPTLKWYPKHSKTGETFDAPRDAESMVQAINQKANLNRQIRKAPSFVLNLDRNTFSSVALDPTKYVMVFFGATWCGHCKRLLPIYEKLANVYTGDSDIIIAKVDCTVEKDLAQRYSVTGFPTLIFFGIDYQDAETYSEARDLSSLIQFINERTGTTRNEFGELGPNEGRLPELEVLLVSSKLNDSVLALMKDRVRALEGKHEIYGEIYIKAAQKVLDRGSKYLTEEVARLEALLKSKDVNPIKKTLFMRRKNILNGIMDILAEKEK